MSSRLAVQSPSILSVNICPQDGFHPNPNTDRLTFRSTNSFANSQSDIRSFMMSYIPNPKSLPKRMNKTHQPESRFLNLIPPFHSARENFEKCSDNETMNLDSTTASQDYWQFNNEPFLGDNLPNICMNSQNEERAEESAENDKPERPSIVPKLALTPRSIPENLNLTQKSVRSKSSLSQDREIDHLKEIRYSNLLDFYFLES